MKCLFRYCKCIRKEFYHIHLVDRCLIIFMFLLLAQSAYSLIFQGNWNTQSNDIDVIVRTSAASIFGYFLSANFIKRDSEGPELKGESLDSEQGDKGDGLDDSYMPGSGTLQILVASAIGLFCLLSLILLRNIKGAEGVEISATASATITQFRDFVSGCVGFLIGHPTSGNSERR